MRSGPNNMVETLLDLLRCPFCGTRLSLVENDALLRRGTEVESGVLGCECCAFPIVAGIPVLVANGAHDRMIDAYGTFAMAGRLPNAKAILYSDAGHGFLFQHIEDFAGEVLAFLE